MLDKTSPTIMLLTLWYNNSTPTTAPATLRNFDIPTTVIAISPYYICFIMFTPRSYEGLFSFPCNIFLYDTSQPDCSLCPREDITPMMLSYLSKLNLIRTLLPQYQIESL